MKSLSVLAMLAAVGAWILWELRPPGYHDYVPPSYDHPYLVFGFESLVALCVAAVLLLGVVAMQRGLRETLVPWSANTLVRVQFVVLSGAAVTAIYGTRQVVQMSASLRGEWGFNSIWFGPSITAALALSPWLVFVAVAVVATVAANFRGAIIVPIVLFDMLAIGYLAFLFAHLGYWACLSCSGPAM